MSLQSFISLYRYALEPIAPLSWFGIKARPIEPVAASRFCTVLRQIKEDLYAKHQRRAGDKPVSMEDRSFLRDACPRSRSSLEERSSARYSPSLVLSGVSPGMYIAAQAIVEYIPVIPPMSLSAELPLSIVDKFTRALLLCSLIPKPVSTHVSPVIVSSPWTLLLSSLVRRPSQSCLDLSNHLYPQHVIANGGFFIMGMVTFLEPTPLTLHMSQPAERPIKPYGWAAMDLWCAPFITGLYTLLTHAQPFWAEFYGVISTILGNSSEKVIPMDPEAARALCALILMGMSFTRTAKNYKLVWKRGEFHQSILFWIGDWY